MFIADRKPDTTSTTYVSSTVNADRIDGIGIRGSGTGTAITIQAGRASVMLYGPLGVTADHVANALAQLSFNSDPWDVVYADEFLEALESFL